MNCITTVVKGRTAAETGIPVHGCSRRKLSAKFEDQQSLGALYAGMAKNYQNEGDLEAAIQYNLRSLQVYEELGGYERILSLHIGATFSGTCGGNCAGKSSRQRMPATFR